MVWLTTFEDMYETHEQCTQLLAVEGVLLLCNVYFNLSGRNVIQQHSYQLEEEPGGRGWRWNNTFQVRENRKKKGTVWGKVAADNTHVGAETRL